MFASTKGTVRRNKLSDFVDVRRSGIIAMKLTDGEGIVGVQICTEKDDVLLTSSGGQCIRFPVTDVRVFTGRTSMGVRGIALDSRRPADFDVDPAPYRRDLGRARGLSEARERDPARHRRRSRRGGSAMAEDGGVKTRTARRTATPAISNSANSAMSNCRRPSSSC